MRARDGNIGLGDGSGRRSSRRKNRVTCTVKTKKTPGSGLAFQKQKKKRIPVAVYQVPRPTGWFFGFFF